jgi:hypothetical protein
MAFKNPAEMAIHAFGGLRNLARAVGRSPAAVVRWRKVGRIPATVQEVVYREALRCDLDLTCEDLVLGRARMKDD